MRVLLFGASGYLGTALGRALREAGDEVTAVVRPGRERTVAPGLRPLGFDLASLGRPVDAGPHDVAIFAAQSRAYRDGPAGWPDVVAVNVLGVSQALDLARRSGVGRFLYLSTGSVYGLGPAPFAEDDPLRPPDVYAESKRMAEALVARAADLFSVLRLRLFALYGPGQEGRLVPGIVGRVLRGEPVTLQPREAGERDPAGFTTSLCHVDDAVAVLCGLRESTLTGVVNLAAPGPVSVREIAEAAGRRLGREPVFEIAEGPRAGDLIADVTRAETRLGHAFRTLEAGLAALVEEATADPAR